MNIRGYIGLSLLLLTVIFIVQNTVVVEIQFLLWKISMSRSLMIFCILAIGIIIGWIISAYFHRNSSSSKWRE
jgi:putative membrane protein